MSARDTRQRILTVAREAFGRGGYEATSVRSIATRAGVDQALVHRYFGTKQQLFLASLELPVDPEVVLAPVVSAPRDRLGETFIRTLLNLWDSDAEPIVLSVVRTLSASPEGAELVKGFLLHLALVHLGPRVDDPEGSAPARLSLVASQTMGLLMVRKVVRLEPLASMPVEDVVALVAPTLQYYMTGELAPSAGAPRPPDHA